MLKKYDIVNHLIKKYNFNNYLEISTPTTGACYDKIIQNNGCEITKELLFYYIDSNLNNSSLRDDLQNFNCINFDIGVSQLKQKKYDLIFVDPFHTFEQSKIDIETAYNLLSDDGIIVVHDCYPKSIDLVSDYYHKGSWCGVTYKAFIDFNMNHNMVQTYVVDCDYGCGIIFKNKKRDIPYKIPDNMSLNDVSEFNYFINNAIELLNVISCEEFLKI